MLPSWFTSFIEFTPPNITLPEVNAITALRITLGNGQTAHVATSYIRQYQYRFTP
jgi:hypothetical protein